MLGFGVVLFWFRLISFRALFLQQSDRYPSSVLVLHRHLRLFLLGGYLEPAEAT